MPIRTHILGFPRIGAARELTLALESHWRGELSEAALEATGQQLRARHWAVQRDAGLAYVTVGDFAFYDQVARHIQLLGCEPARFDFGAEQSPLSRYFTMARGGTSQAEHAGCRHGHALEVSKWFDTNYHYLVPELSPHTQFSLACERLLAEVAEAQALGHQVKAALIGPLTFLWLGKEKTPGFERLALLEQLLPVYGGLLDRLKQQGVAWVQLEEPILGLDLPHAWRSAFESAYWQLNQVGVNILLATYFSPLEENLSLTCRLPVAGLHVDGIRAPHELVSVTDWLPAHKVLSIGIVDGRNIWRTDLDAALAVLQPLAAKRKGHLWLAPSCSLLHVPFSLEAETDLDGDIKSWLAFATEKLTELALLKDALEGHPDDTALARSRRAIASRRASPRVHRAAVAQRLQTLSPTIDRRDSGFPLRQAAQHARLRLPDFPTTTIGAFPQTPAIRAEIAHAVGRQEALGLDVLVHGEAERNDMVDYFGEQLDGFVLTRHGWVQSCGSRCVKPPIIYGDVQRPAPMTVAWTAHAQSLTSKPMKGTLTGPVTLLQWSFVRDDQPRAATALQLALAIRDEVQDLETAGIGIIQIDEPAIREGLPLRRGQWDAYLDWATRAFRIAASVVSDTTQIHTHMCYAEFNDILPQIAAMDADVITIETSRSDVEPLTGSVQFQYSNEIGPGVYGIHSPRIPTAVDMVTLRQKASGLKTRGSLETETALRHMVEAARQMRAA
ncbi:5-methyltetrahydropteroyltriglutamate--homocysteine methyltransferase [Janthinobacterium sp. HH103]|uniref:5-methyltetrahydropteroyltriglutamate-- homocysteine S-methyltransferase n=1 Tax=unclassified Janthinobacterium TaxID=2610881 RepID=UPI0008743684|nr:MULTISPECIES: 5-methyltetrahydropteroyltriglutamate--homocysteine S-methyltransferase [unclassified Janthinobacterium]OEZ65237.1 5-methyltetrahydropteroyltriglutamate--homocysteine methyltransferase [Janthinobacterium sp. HH100]OEZ84437.1 5-methyltetrahydropteroyltriglutamate--homocysteine methyltransferase [Janthinobacterium sp. HH103]QOU71034.1 5-methyltetrahydropteroyltriglutamate--homocysteine methyltransferase [Janthinobacterium sp. HH102]